MAERRRPLVSDKVKLDSLPNPFWDKVSPYLTPPSDDPRQRLITGGSPTIGSMYDDSFMTAWRLRHELTRVYSWSIPSPGAVKFVAEHSQGQLIDPIAGTGYWAMLLSWLGVRVLAYDESPPQPDYNTNPYHTHARQHVNVRQADAEYSTSVASRAHTLFLSWPDMSDCADRALTAYRGDRLIYIGEGMSGCTGDDNFHTRLETDWEEIDWHPIPQWIGLHDHLWVYTRKNTSPAA